MKRSLGILRQGYSGRLLAHQSAFQPRSNPSLYKLVECRLHTAAVTSYPFSTHPLRSEHTLNPATSSSSTSSNDNPPIPLPSHKKRTSATRQGASAQSRSTTVKDALKSTSSNAEGKRGKTAANSVKESLSAAEDLVKAKAPEPQSTSTITRPSTTTEASSPAGGKKSEPPKTLLDRAKSLWENIKYLFRFYYNGTKQIWKDRGTVADLKKKIAEREAQGGEGIRWIENAKVKQHESDLRKLPLFLAILLILEEILPLVVIYAPSLLPSTCVLPSQSTKMRSGEERLRGLAIQDLAKNEHVRVVVEQIVTASETKKGGVNEEKLQPLATLGSEALGQIAHLFALSARGTGSMKASRIERHLSKVESNDELLRRAYMSRNSSNQWKEITHSDWLWKACAQRGLRAFEAENQVMEQNLIAYLHLTTDAFHSTHRSLLPLALYDGTSQDLARLQGEAKEELSKGIRRRTQEVVEEVKEAEKRKETH